VPRLIPALSAVIAYLLLNNDAASAWGPATHVQLASDVLTRLDALPAAIAALLAKFSMDFLYGNIAADVVFAKRLSRIKQFCHHWTTGFGLLEQASEPADKAFAYGYLTHLAGDTVAHNKFIPRQVTVTRTTRSIGHVYWEIRADADVAPLFWRRLRQTVCTPFPNHDALMARQLDRGVLPFKVNRRIFNRMHKVQSHRWWFHTVRVWDRVARWELSDQMLARYRRETADCAIELLTNGTKSPLLHVDPNGSVALRYTKHTRRYLRRMRRAGLLSPHVLAEVTHHHEPATVGGIRPLGGSIL